MNGAIKIWLSAAYHPVYRCGGWASVRVGQGGRRGLAGGERNTTADRIALAGLVAALRDLPPGAVVEVRTTSAELAGFAGVIAGLGGAAPVAAPEQDLDLWAQIIAASAGRSVTLVHVQAAPGTPLTFAAAWADLARDKAKATGAFSAAIPKPNLAKIAGLDSRS
jgi:ribonuclease HI